MTSTLEPVSTIDHDVVLLAPEEETVPESSPHVEDVDLLYDGLRARYADTPDVVVCCRLGWFPDRDDTRVRLDPDLMIVMGRPKGDRTSYRQWAEDNTPPTVLIEVRSEHDTDADYRTRLDRARRYGAGEVVMVAPFSPGGTTVTHLTVDPDDDSSWRIAAVSANASQPVRVETLGIDLAGGSELVVSDEVSGRWVDGATAIGKLERVTAERDRLVRKLRDAGIDPDA